MLLGLELALAGGASGEDSHTDLPPSHSVQPVVVATGFEQALGVAVDRDQNVYAPTYRQRSAIGRVTPDGSASIFARLDQTAPGENNAPQGGGLRLDAQGRLIVADRGAGRVLRLSNDGGRTEVLADRFEGAKLRSVRHVALDRAGNVYFSEADDDDDAAAGRVLVYRIRTQQVVLLADGLRDPTGLAVSTDQRTIYVAEGAQRRMLQISLTTTPTPTAEVLLAFPSKTEESIRGGEFGPAGMVVDRQGRLYVAMSTGQVINVIDPGRAEIVRQYSVDATAADCHFADTSLCVATPDKEAVFRMPIGVEGFAYAH